MKIRRRRNPSDCRTFNCHNQTPAPMNNLPLHADRLPLFNVGDLVTILNSFKQVQGRGRIAAITEARYIGQRPVMVAIVDHDDFDINGGSPVIRSLDFIVPHA